MLIIRVEKQVKEKQKKKLDSKYVESIKVPTPGDFVLMKQNNKVGILSEIRGKKAVVNYGAMPLQVNFSDLTTVIERVIEPNP